MVSGLVDPDMVALCGLDYVNVDSHFLDVGLVDITVFSKFLESPLSLYVQLLLSLTRFDRLYWQLLHTSRNGA